MLLTEKLKNLNQWKILKNLSIRKKLLIYLIIFSVTLVLTVTMIALSITYNTMREQLIYNRRMSIGWLHDRIDLEIKSYTNQFYEFEVDKVMKADINTWCTTGEEPDYIAKWRLISSLNEAISMDSNINSIEIYNLAYGKVLLAQRSGASIVSTGDRLDKWQKRDPNLQTNIMFQKSEKEILVMHQIYRFEDNLPLALVIMRLRPFEIQDILENIKMAEDESILLFNDQNELIEAEYGTNATFDSESLKGIIKQLEDSDSQEMLKDGNYWFYRSVNRDKLQILLTVPDHTILSALSETLMGGLLIALIAVIVSVIGSFLFSRTFTKPIINLSSQMRTLTLHDYTCVKPQSRQDEIGVLQDSFGIMVERNQKLIAQEYQSKIEKRNAQIRALQAQINPHFMYNTLQVIGGMALKKQAVEIYNITVALGDIMRYSLNFSREMVTIREEIQYLRSYLSIQNQRFNNRIAFNLDIPEDVMLCLIPKLILQPILENSFEYAFTGKAGNWEIELKGSITASGDLLLIISDNGQGISPERLQEIQEKLSFDAERALNRGSHIGLGNVDSRIRLKFPGEGYGVTISSELNKGATIKILMKAVKEVQ
jgi:sensor histidine kinase YesM